MLTGKKTYLAAGAIVLVAVGGFLSGELNVTELATQILAGLGLGALRVAL